MPGLHFTYFVAVNCFFFTQKVLCQLSSFCVSKHILKIPIKKIIYIVQNTLFHFFIFPWRKIKRMLYNHYTYLNVPFLWFPHKLYTILCNTARKIEREWAVWFLSFWPISISVSKRSWKKLKIFIKFILISLKVACRFRC